MHSFTVRGYGPFPIDMLRYDRACPDREADSAIIERTFRPRERSKEAVEVRLVTNERVTHARWESFGWKASAA